MNLRDFCYGCGVASPHKMRQRRAMRAISKPAWAWALYDWANSAFALSVLVVFYGPFFTLSLIHI